VARIGRQPVPVGDVVLPFYAIEEVAGSTRFVVLHGHAPRHRGEVVLGPDSASTFGVGIGDQVEIGAAGRFTVVGIGLLPTTPHSSFDQGGWLLADDVVAATPASVWAHLRTVFGATGPLGDADLREAVFARGDVVARLADGADIEAVAARITREADGAVSVTPATQPADQQNLRNVRALPGLFAGFLLVLALGALAHVSASVLRRRRSDLAIFRCLGLTPRQIRACLAWQATTLVAIALVVGVPVGLALGRNVWRLVTNATPMVYAAPVATLTLVVIVPAALIVANLLAAIPGRRAARLHPAEVLRTE
jgi:ABC-type antimicrobial peptide transport system permease subunit